MLCPSMPVVATGLHHDVKHAGPKKGPRTKPCVAFRRGGFLGQKTAPKMGPRILKIFKQGINLKHAAGCGTTASWLRLGLAGSGALRAPFPSREKPRQFVRGGKTPSACVHTRVHTHACVVHTRHAPCALRALSGAYIPPKANLARP